jgi:catechol 2,3-dioxygenase-like lactoylglutathione lyase family enzyme
MLLCLSETNRCSAFYCLGERRRDHPEELNDIALNSSNMKITHLDHIVLTVKNVEASCTFYTNVLGMQEVTFGHGRKAVIFGNQKINFHQQGQELEPKALCPTPGSGDLCFITTNSLADVIQHIHDCEVAIIEEPLERTGALGSMLSIYIRDPDRNLIEIATYQQR